ncbi:MAG: tetratricopeptide repeat protein [Acidobacteriaceae bacterium]|nr:tetratricopeptide repeat protein [Acidobacteriaceae bacterium]
MQLLVILLLAGAVTLCARQAPLERAWDLAANGKRGEAIAVLQQLIGNDPRNADARLLLGSLLMEQGERAASIEQLSAAAHLRPRSWEAQNALGEAYNRFGDTAAAQAAFETAIALKPDYGIAQSNLGQVLLARGDIAGAAKHLDRAVALLGGTDEAADTHYVRAKAYTAQNQSDKAAGELEQAVRLRPNFAEAWSDLGQTRKLLLDDPGALTAFEHAVAANPQDPVAQYRLGAEYLRQENLHSALDHLQKAYLLNPEDQSTLNALQIALRQNGDVEGANRIKLQLAQLLRDRDRVNQNKLAAVKLNNEGAALEKAGDLKGALAKYRQAAQLDPDHVGICINLGVALLRSGQWTEGLDELHAALVRDPNNAQLKAALKDALAQAPPSLIPKWKAGGDAQP